MTTLSKVNQSVAAGVVVSKVIASHFHGIYSAVKNKRFTHFWLKGGRGSTKSSFVAICIVLGVMRDPEAHAVIFRKVKDTLKSTVYQQIVWAINILGVRDYWNIPQSTMELTYLPTGQKIVFKGADNPKKVKSIAWAFGSCKFLWYEELDEFGGIEEIRSINQSMVRGDDECTVFYTYNPPKSGANWVNAEALLERPDRMVFHSTYLDVPREWLGKLFINEAEHLKATKPEAYDHEYMGKVTGTGGEIFGNVTLRAISDEEIEGFEQIRRGLDFGYGADPSVYAAVNFDRKMRILYIYHEHYGYRMSNASLHKAIQAENFNNDLVLGDSAEPRTINELNQLGSRVSGVKKGPDSVNYGIKFMQDLEQIVIDPERCPKTAEEFTQYELDRAADGTFKDGFPDHDNHAIDAVRYSLNFDILLHKEEEKKKEERKINWDYEKPKEDPLVGRGEFDESFFMDDWG